MNIGELWDRLRAIDAAAGAIVDAERALTYGGSVDTMARKHDELAARKAELERLRAEPV